MEVVSIKVYILFYNLVPYIFGNKYYKLWIVNIVNIKNN